MSEIFDIVDENGMPTGETVERSVAHHDGILHRTAHVWIAREVSQVVIDGKVYEGKNYQVLMQKRSMNKDSFPGQLDTSSAGHVHSGDEPLESAIREVKEELGLEIAPEELQFAGTFRIDYKGEFHDEPFLDNEVAFMYVYFKDVDLKDIVVQPEEVESVEWVNVYDAYIGCMKQEEYCVPMQEMRLLSDFLLKNDKEWRSR